MKVVRYILVVGFLGYLVSSCVKDNNYPAIPNITYRSFTPFCTGNNTDSAYIQINFTDGDGDIGYDPQDASAPFDFYAMEYVNNNGNYVPVVTSGSDTLIFQYHIPDITPAGKNKSLNGIIQLNFESSFSLNKQLGTTITGFNYYDVEFKVWIFDRAGHKSNVIFTPALTLCQ